MNIFNNLAYGQWTLKEIENEAWENISNNIYKIRLICFYLNCNIKANYNSFFIR